MRATGTPTSSAATMPASAAQPNGTPGRRLRAGGGAGEQEPGDGEVDEPGRNADAGPGPAGPDPAPCRLAGLELAELDDPVQRPLPGLDAVDAEVGLDVAVLVEVA